MNVLQQAGLVNVALLMLYIGLNYLEWRNVLMLPWVAYILWAPLRITIWISSTSASEPAMIDGVLWIDKWSFLVLLVMVVINLVAIWKAEQGKTSAKPS